MGPSLRASSRHSSCCTIFDTLQTSATTVCVLPKGDPGETRKVHPFVPPVPLFRKHCDTTRVSGNQPLVMSLRDYTLQPDVIRTAPFSFRYMLSLWFINRVTLLCRSPVCKVHKSTSGNGFDIGFLRGFLKWCVRFLTVAVPGGGAPPGLTL